jgi:hypothetical protein
MLALMGQGRGVVSCILFPALSPFFLPYQSIPKPFYTGSRIFIIILWKKDRKPLKGDIK